MRSVVFVFPEILIVICLTSLQNLTDSSSIICNESATPNVPNNVNGTMHARGGRSFLKLTNTDGKIRFVKNSTTDVRNVSYFQDDMITTACVQGLWLFYSEPNFNWDPSIIGPIKMSSNERIYSPNLTTFHKFGFKVKSFRPAGDPKNFGSPTVTLYLGDNFCGPSTTITDSQYPDMPYSKSKSLIVTGTQPWLFYTQANFVQKTVCIDPVRGKAVFIPNFYRRIVTKPLRHISSAWKGGCDPAKARFVYLGKEDS